MKPLSVDIPLSSSLPISSKLFACSLAVGYETRSGTMVKVGLLMWFKSWRNWIISAVDVLRVTWLILDR